MLALEWLETLESNPGWEYGGRIIHQVQDRWHGPGKGSTAGGSSVESAGFGHFCIVSSLFDRISLKNFSTTPNTFVDPDRSIGFDLMLNCLALLEMLTLVDRTRKSPGISLQEFECLI